MNANRQHSVSRIHRPSTDHRSALASGLGNERSPPAATGGLHGGKDENHHLRAHDEFTARTEHSNRLFDLGRQPMSGLPDGWWVNVAGVYVVVGLPRNSVDGQADMNDTDALALADRLIAAAEAARRTRRSIEDAQ
jgi:hypothetical protein